MFRVALTILIVSHILADIALSDFVREHGQHESSRVQHVVGLTVLLNALVKVTIIAFGVAAILSIKSPRKAAWIALAAFLVGEAAASCTIVSLGFGIVAYFEPLWSVASRVALAGALIYGGVGAAPES